MDIEDTFSAVSNNQSVCIHARDQMDTCNMEKIQAMKNAVAAFVPADQREQIEVKSSSPALLPPSKTTSTTSHNKSDSPKMISGSQNNLLRKLLHENEISVQDFCNQNGVNRIEDLTMAKARVIIRDLTNN